MRRKAFTLIELLAVVAILGLLAVIAVPQYLKADVRSRISQSATDMRSIAQALEAYKIDQKQYPMDFQFYQLGPGSHFDPFSYLPLGRLTTPVAYLIALPRDAFKYEYGVWDGGQWDFGYKADLMWRNYVLPTAQINPDARLDKHWALFSPGPNQRSNNGPWAMFGEEILNSTGPFAGGGPGCLYDPTNGTVSAGDIVRTGP